MRKRLKWLGVTVALAMTVASAPAAAWSGIRPATSYGSACPQGSGSNEDCLYLNVYRPARATNQRLPVLLSTPSPSPRRPARGSPPTPR